MDYWNTFLAWYILSSNEISNNYKFKQSMNKINDAYKTAVMNTLQCNTETFRMQIDSQKQNQAVMNTLQCNTETFRMQIDSQKQNQAVINSLDTRNWCNTYYEVERSVKVTDNIIETETSLIPHDVKCESDCTSKKKSIFDGVLDFLEALVNELNGIIAYVLEDY